MNSYDIIKDIDDRIYPVSVNYEKSIKELIRDGNYSRSTPPMIADPGPKWLVVHNPFYPLSPEQDVKIKIIDFNWSKIIYDKSVPVYETILKCFRRIGFRPCNIYELLSLRKKYIFSRFPKIFALGSVWIRVKNKKKGIYGKKRIPCLCPLGPCVYPLAWKYYLDLCDVEFFERIRSLTAKDSDDIGRFAAV